MEKYLTKENLLYSLLIIATFCLYKVWKYQKSDAQVLLKQLNTSTLHATKVVDLFAKKYHKTCTRFIVETIIIMRGVKYDAHLSVYIGNEHFDYGRVNNKWVLMKN